MMKTRILKKRIDLQNLTPLTNEQRARLCLLASRPVIELDYSDIPPLRDAFWKSATRNRFYKPTKQAITVRVDSVVLPWLKAEVKDYQTLITAILRQAMLQALYKP